MEKKRKGPPQKKYKKPPETEISIELRLNRFIANAGVCSRREADTLISGGKVKVNGKVVREMGVKVRSSDKVIFDGKRLYAEQKKYVLLNKPKDFITTMDDPQNRRTVMKLVDKAAEERIYPVGRLDRMTTGLLLFTNDGVLAKKMTHPSHKVRKIYQVELSKPITEADFNTILAGVELEDGLATVNELVVLDEKKTQLGIEIHIGRNRIIRRIFEHMGYDILKLDRVMFGSLTKKDLPRGKWRHLSESEVRNLTR